MILGIGVDVVEIDRVATALARTPSMHDRLFTADEQAFCGGRVASLAARFAAKEAVAKAIGTGIGRGFSFIDVEVVADGHGRPAVVLQERAATVAAGRGIVAIHLSLSTSVSVATAFAVAEGRRA